MVEKLTAQQLQQLASTPDDTHHLDTPHVTHINQQDVARFQAELADHVAVTPTQATSGENLNPLGHLAALEAEAMDKLQQLSTSLNPGDYMKTARALSAYQLESLVTTKVIAKSTQALEKLTNLQ